MNKEKQKIEPELRFPEFKDDEKWVKTNLGSIGNPLMCKRIFKEQTTTSSENAIPFFKIGTFGREADAFIPIELYNDFKSKYSFPNIGDILISASGTIGRLVVYDGADAYFQDSNIVWIGNDETQITNSLLFYCYSTLVWQTSDGGVIKRLYNSNLKEMEIYFPSNLKEQQKIANCLSSLDDVINAETEKLDLLQDHKKGLLQQLFPKQGETQPKYRFSEFKNDGDWKQDDLGKSLKVESSQIAKSRLNFKDEGFPVFGADGFNGFIDNYSQEKDYVAIVKDGSGVGNLYYCEGKSSVLGTLNYLLSKNEENYDIKWLYYLLNTINFKPFIKGANIPHIYFKDYSKLLVSYPKNPKEQQKIAACLSSADELIEAQTKNLELLQDHKKGLLQQLFPNINELSI